MTPPNFMVIGLQIGKLHGGGGGIHHPPLALPDSEKPGLFTVDRICFFNCGEMLKSVLKVYVLTVYLIISC